MNAQLDMAPGKSAELWVILAGQPAQSLGVIKEGQAQRLPLPAALTGAGQTTSLLAVTLEQLGGSPTGIAQGPVVATGRFKDS